MYYGKLNPLAMAWVFGIFDAAATLFISITGQIGIATEVLEMTDPWYISQLENPIGAAFGTIEGLAFGFIVGYLFAWLYNKLD